MCFKPSVSLRCHTIERLKDEKLRHHVDREAQKKFDLLHPDFTNDAHNDRLDLSTDKFNFFQTMSISNSTWAVMLVNYNLAPWICIKLEYIIFSMIITGPSSPRNDIDLHLQPLIAELKALWDVGVEMYDVETNKTFDMYATLL